MVRIEAIIAAYAEIICGEVEFRWGQYSSLPQVDGEANMEPVEIKRVAQSMIMLTLTAGGQKALLLEYGKGSLMDMTNPGLQDYLDWYHFNPERRSKDMAVLSRYGYYTDLDGNPHYGKSKKPGTNLEETGIPMFQPLEPLHIIRNIIFGPDGESGMLIVILGAIADEVAMYDFFANMPSKIKL